MACPNCESERVMLEPEEIGGPDCPPSAAFWYCLDCDHDWPDDGPDEIGLYKMSREYSESL